jgi:hypothetical protein
VSNSQIDDFDQFQREKNLLLEQDRNKHLVYFSSLSVYRSNTPYNQHKKDMELLIKDNFPYYTIIRIEVIEWGRNPTTIHNVFRDNISKGYKSLIKDDFRYVVSIKEFLYWMSLIPLWERTEMNITGVRHSIQQIYDRVKQGTL